MTLAPASSAATGFRAPRHDDPEDDAIDLIGFVRLLWRHRIPILAAALLCGGAAAAWGISQTRVYSAEASIVLTQSKLADRVDAATGSMVTFQSLLQSRTIAAGVIQELGFDKPPRQITVSRFIADVIAVEWLRNSTVFVVKATLDDPALAAKTANRVAEKAVELARRINQQEAQQSRDDLLQQRDEAKLHMEEATSALRTFKTRSQIELVRKDVDAMLGQRGELLNLLVQIESEKAKLARAEQELAGRHRIDTVKRSIDSDPQLMESARRGAASSSELLGLQTRNEFVDEVYQKLDEQAATSRATLAGLERRKTQLVDVRRLDASQLEQLTRLYDLEAEQSRLDMERELATAVYRQVATAYETARVQVASRSTRVDILEAALPADRPVSRNVARNSVLAALVGVVLASAVVVIRAAAAP